MIKLQIDISEQDFRDYNLEKKSMQFSDLMKKIDSINAKNAMLKSIKIAKQSGLDKLNEEEINYEISEVRNAKNHS